MEVFPETRSSAGFASPGLRLRTGRCSRGAVRLGGAAHLPGGPKGPVSPFWPGAPSKPGSPGGPGKPTDPVTPEREERAVSICAWRAIHGLHLLLPFGNVFSGLRRGQRRARDYRRETSSRSPKSATHAAGSLPDRPPHAVCSSRSWGFSPASPSFCCHCSAGSLGKGRDVGARGDSMLFHFLKCFPLGLILVTQTTFKLQTY